MGRHAGRRAVRNEAGRRNHLSISEKAVAVIARMVGAVKIHGILRIATFILSPVSTRSNKPTKTRGKR